MARFGLRNLSVLFLLLFATVIAACTNGMDEPTPSPTSTPDPVQTPDPTATPEPEPTATPEPVTNEQVLSDAGAVLAALESVRFGFTLVGPTRSLQGSGAWAAGDYELLVETEACPPSVEGVPNPDECPFVPMFEGVGVGNEVYGHRGDGEWTATERTGDGWYLGPWADNFDVQQFELPLSEGPAVMAQAVLDFVANAPVVEMAQGSLERVAVYQLTAWDSGSSPTTSFQLSIDQETYQVLQAVLTMHPDNPTVWTWTFSDHGEEISVEAPGEE